MPVPELRFSDGTQPNVTEPAFKTHQNPVSARLQAGLKPRSDHKSRVFSIFAASRMGFMHYWYVLSIGMPSNMSELTFLLCAALGIEIWRRESSKCGRIHLKNGPISTPSLVNLQRGSQISTFFQSSRRPAWVSCTTGMFYRLESLIICPN